MGGWRFAAARLRRVFPQGPVRAATREESASPATGSYRHHAAEHKLLMDDAFGM
jgi:2-oxoglutarate dehydrogenase complex dehydrogenase (E1) component-like enzyme